MQRPWGEGLHPEQNSVVRGEYQRGGPGIRSLENARVYPWS